jgi:hypothetical protein
MIPRRPQASHGNHTNENARRRGRRIDGVPSASARALIQVPDTHPRSAGQHAAIPRIRNTTVRQRLLNQHLLPGVLTIAVGVDPVLPVAATVGWDWRGLDGGR